MSKLCHALNNTEADCADRADSAVGFNNALGDAERQRFSAVFECFAAFSHGWPPFTLALSSRTAAEMLMVMINIPLGRGNTRLKSRFYRPQSAPCWCKA